MPGLCAGNARKTPFSRLARWRTPALSVLFGVIVFVLLREGAASVRAQRHIDDLARGALLRDRAVERGGNATTNRFWRVMPRWQPPRKVSDAAVVEPRW